MADRGEKERIDELSGHEAAQLARTRDMGYRNTHLGSHHVQGHDEPKTLRGCHLVEKEREESHDVCIDNGELEHAWLRNEEED